MNVCFEKSISKYVIGEKISNVYGNSSVFFRSVATMLSDFDIIIFFFWKKGSHNLTTFQYDFLVVLFLKIFLFILEKSYSHKCFAHNNSSYV